MQLSEMEAILSAMIWIILFIHEPIWSFSNMYSHYRP